MPLFSRQLAHPGGLQVQIASNPRLQILRETRLLFLLPLLAVTFVTLFTSVSMFTLGVSDPLWLSLGVVVVLALQGAFFSLVIHYWRPIERKRLAVVLGDYRLQADEQPYPNPDALRLPTRITTGAGPFLEYRLWALFLLLACVWLALFFSVIGTPLSLNLFNSPWLNILISALMAPGFLLFFIWCITRKRHFLEVTQEGIRTRGADGKTIIMNWSEMRLFACYPEPGPWKDSPALICELSSAEYVIHWVWVQRESPFRRIGVSWCEHDGQMRAFCALIVAQTGLPLYDLSKGMSSREVEHREYQRDG